MPREMKGKLRDPRLISSPRNSERREKKLVLAVGKYCCSALDAVLRR